jgi:hypothetical protein
MLAKNACARLHGRRRVVLNPDAVVDLDLEVDSALALPSVAFEAHRAGRPGDALDAFNAKSGMRECTCPEPRRTAGRRPRRAYPRRQAEARATYRIVTNAGLGHRDDRRRSPFGVASVCLRKATMRTRRSPGSCRMPSKIKVGTARLRDIRGRFGNAGATILAYSPTPAFAKRRGPYPGRGAT